MSETDGPNDPENRLIAERRAKLSAAARGGARVPERLQARRARGRAARGVRVA